MGPATFLLLIIGRWHPRIQIKEGVDRLLLRPTIRLPRGPLLMFYRVVSTPPSSDIRV